MDISATPSTRPARAPGLVARWQQRFSSSRRPRHDDPRMFAPLHEGDDYLTLLARLHRALEPRNYLEIGVRRGDSLALATCPVIGIDPAMAPKREVFREKPSVFLFPLTSDTFFERHDPTALFGRPVDMAFLDGLHEYETLLRDFVNTERHCQSNSVVVLHDCLPTDLGMVRRSLQDPPGPTRDPSAWAGDVWKLVPILRRHRPDLRMCLVNAPPTGLVMITGLDPSNVLLRNNYDAILDEFGSLDLGTIGVAAHLASLPVQDTRTIFCTPETIRASFPAASKGKQACRS